MLKLISQTHHRSNSMVTMILSTAFWGLGMVMTKGMLEYIPPLTLLLIQLTTSVTLYWAIVLIGKRFDIRKIKPKQNQNQTRGLWELLKLGFPGLLEPGFSYMLGSIGLTMTTASSASLLGTSEPVMTVAVAWLLLREKISYPLIIFAAVAVVGVTFTIGLDFNLNGHALFGDLLILAGTFCASFYAVLSSQSVKKLSPVHLAAIQQSFGLVFVAVVWFCISDYNELAQLNINLRLWCLAFASGIVQYQLPFWLYLVSLQKLPASIAAQFLSLIPVFATFAAYFFLNERLNLSQGIGMMLIITAVIGIARLKEVASL